MFRYRIINGDAHDALMTVDDRSVQCCVTSPPYYGLRDYGADGQIGVEDTPEEYIGRLVAVFREVRRVLKDDGTLWLNIGDSYCNSNGYARASEQFQRQGRNDAPANDRDLAALHGAGYKTKDLMGIPWMLAFALRADGWYLRQDIIWHKPNPMPESVTDRCTKSHEYVFLLSKSPQYYFDHEAIQEPAVSIPVGTGAEITTKRRFGGNKYGDSDDPHYQTKSGKEWKPQMKNLQYKGQTAHTMHERLAEGSPDEMYAVRNKRDVWSVSVKPYSGAHFATFPPDLITPMILAGSREGDTVLDPFTGSGTTGYVCKKLGRNFLGTELNPEYVALAKDRIDGKQIGLEDYIEEAGG